jgi:hypothetical protein
MLSHFTRLTFAFALALAAHGSIPGWTSAAFAASAPQTKCTAKSHQHAKVAAAKPAKPTKWVGGGAGAQMRRSPDIQILSFGP